MLEQMTIISELRQRFPGLALTEQKSIDGAPIIWLDRENLRDVLKFLKHDVKPRYAMLFDLTAIDERARRMPADQPASDFTLVYRLLSLDGNSDICLKVPLSGEHPSVPTITDLWMNANWYEREVWDMFGITFEEHPYLRRILSPADWVGHPLRKEHPARATDMEGYTLSDSKGLQDDADLQFRPEEHGLPPATEDAEYMYLNLGPHHPGMHGLLRLVLRLDGECIQDMAVDIGWHHRGAEKMAERQTFHTYIPYTDRIDYLAGIQNNLPYVLAVEKLAGIVVPLRAQVMRVMLSELFRIANHLVYLGTFGADIGAISPVFFTFNDRERVFGIIEAICGGRMHPEWLRIGGTTQDLPDGWQTLVNDFICRFPASLSEYRKMLIQNSIFKDRTKGVGIFTAESAIEWGVTGPNLRSTGVDWDLRKKRPYSGYEQFEFEVPTASDGDTYSRVLMRLEEMNQSLNIIKQAVDNMPDGDYKSDSRFAMPPRKEKTMQDIETLINHFLSVSWGQPLPSGEVMVTTEAPKGCNGYYLISDGSSSPYRCRIRTASFPHIQAVPMLSEGLLVSDLISILGSLDYVLADVDR